jgi:hypothetical protein
VLVISYTIPWLAGYGRERSRSTTMKGKNVKKFFTIGAASIMFAGISIAAHADQRFYDSRGNHVGSVSRDSAGNSRYYDSRGRSAGTSSPTSSGRNYYDSRGSKIGSSSR